MKTLLMHYIPSSTEDRARFYQDGLTDIAAQVKALVPGFAQLPASVIDEDILLLQDQFPLRPTRRLVVLIPPGEIDESALARRVWQFAVSSCCSVLYLTLSSDASQSAYQRRRLADLAARTSGQNIQAHARVSDEKDWRQALEQILRPGDLLVCLACHQVSNHFIWHKKLGEQLVESMLVPVYLFGGIKIGPSPRGQLMMRNFLSWVISLFLLAVFFSLQVIIDRSTDKLLSTILLFLSVVVEVYLLVKVNEWFW